jgi:anti-anti-sigma factor
VSSEPASLDIVETREGERVRVVLRGELDLGTAPQVVAGLRRLRERGEQVLLDLDELGFIDVSGLRAVLTAADEAANDGGMFAVTRGSPPVRRLVALVLDGQLPLDGGPT